MARAEPGRGDGAFATRTRTEVEAEGEGTTLEDRSAVRERAGAIKILGVVRVGGSSTASIGGGDRNGSDGVVATAKAGVAGAQEVRNPI